jgi:hypothetical protein
MWAGWSHEAVFGAQPQGESTPVVLGHTLAPAHNEVIFKKITLGLGMSSNPHFLSPKNLDYQPTKRLWQGIDRGEDKLWTRLNQLDP